MRILEPYCHSDSWMAHFCKWNDIKLLSPILLEQVSWKFLLFPRLLHSISSMQISLNRNGQILFGMLTKLRPNQVENLSTSEIKFSPIMPALKKLKKDYSCVDCIYKWWWNRSFSHDSRPQIPKFNLNNYKNVVLLNFELKYPNLYLGDSESCKKKHLKTQHADQDYNLVLLNTNQELILQ